MKNYKIYCDLKSDLAKKKRLLSNLKKAVANEQEVLSLEIEIEEELNALNMIFNHLILQHSSRSEMV
ncbi:MAG: hypothetical protein EOP42_05610 [Sphingobacteriaceae bacterium]|nr:MAG: hypothetical protein EOP42_05610 [Sphingobacteriaceae bacterium]